MKLPDELLDKFKYAITDEDIPMLEEVFKAGMLAAADIAEPIYENAFPHGNKTVSEIIADEIRRAAE